MPPAKGARFGAHMIDQSFLAEKIQAGIPDAKVEAIDTVGDAQHWRVIVISAQFEGLGRLARHRMVLDTLADVMGDGKPIHAVEIKPFAPAELG